MNFGGQPGGIMIQNIIEKVITNTRTHAHTRRGREGGRDSITGSVNALHLTLPLINILDRLH